MYKHDCVIYTTCYVVYTVQLSKAIPTDLLAVDELVVKEKEVSLLRMSFGDLV